MSEPKRIKPPPLKLGEFATPPQSGQARPSFYSEESTMITALSDLERKKLATGGSLPKPRGIEPPNKPPQVPRPHSSSTLDELVQIPAPNLAVNLAHEEVGFADTNRVNVDQFGAKNQTDDSISAEEHCVIEPIQNVQDPQRSRAFGNGVIVVFNVRGGVGASTLAVNMAGAAHHHEREVALVDLDLQLGSLSSMFDGKPLERSLAELVMEASESEHSVINSAVDERAGLSLIAQEGRIGEIGLITPDRLPKFFEAVKAQHDIVIIDGVRTFSDHAVTAMDFADTILLVATQDVPALRSARKVLSLVRRLGYSRDKVRLVINRHYSRSALSVEEIEERLDYDVFEVLPSDFKFVSSLIEQGQLARDVDLKHEVTVGFDRLACRLMGLELPEPPGFFSKLFSKWSR
jgi:MinD-like ATPase involved in chromosome partitioning or flagellar assembly